MKHGSDLCKAALLLIAGMLSTYSDVECQIAANPTILTFANETSSPSPAQTFVLTNNTGDDLPYGGVLTSTTSPLVRIALEGGTFQTSLPRIPMAKNTSVTIYVEIVTDTPVVALNEAISMICGWNNTSVQIKGSAPLPIQLASFNACTPTGNGVLLTWTTVSETNNYGFNVQRNGATIAFIHGHGTTVEQHAYSFTDNPDPGKYQYRLQQIDLDGGIHYTDAVNVQIAPGVNASAPARMFSLSHNYPNPFNPSTTIRYSLAHRAHVTLSVFNVLGENVATLVNAMQEPGSHDVRFDAAGFASGAYFYRLQADGFTQTRQLHILR
jgi:hypothetical protein